MSEVRIAEHSTTYPKHDVQPEAISLLSCCIMKFMMPNHRPFVKAQSRESIPRVASGLNEKTCGPAFLESLHRPHLPPHRHRQKREEHGSNMSAFDSGRALQPQRIPTLTDYQRKGRAKVEYGCF